MGGTFHGGAELGSVHRVTGSSGVRAETEPFERIQFYYELLGSKIPELGVAELHRNLTDMTPASYRNVIHGGYVLYGGKLAAHAS